jgi:hypothetical protein
LYGPYDSLLWTSGFVVGLVSTPAVHVMVLVKLVLPRYRLLGGLILDHLGVVASKPFWVVDGRTEGRLYDTHLTLSVQPIRKSHSLDILVKWLPCHLWQIR